MTDAIELQRRFFAEEIQAVANLRTSRLVEALATVRREAFLPPGPWVIRAEGDIGGPPRQTADADPRHLSQRVRGHRSRAQPVQRRAERRGDVHRRARAETRRGGVARRLRPRLLQRGDGALCGAGRASDRHRRRSAAGRRSSDGLAGRPNIDAAAGNGVEGLPAGGFDAVLVNAGMSHPHDAWLRALKPGGRLVVPLTASMAAMGPIGKGVVALVANTGDPATWSARVLTFVAIYSAVGIREDSMNEKLAAAFRKSPWPAFTRLRRDAHDEGPSCWLHGPGSCLSA